MLKILLVGYGELAEGLLSGILTTQHEVVGVLSWNRRQKNEVITSTLFPDNVEKLRRKHKLRSIEVEDINSFKFTQIANSLKPDIILIGSWGQILKKHVIDIPSKYCINCHPSYLPEHRGSNPYASTIMYGSLYSGVTFHQVDEGIDTGNIILQEKIAISANETGGSLRVKCSKVAKRLVVDLLEKIENNNLTLTPQNNNISSYYQRIKVTDGSIDWSNDPEVIYNRIRGLHPWIFSYSVYKNKIILIKKVNIIELEKPISSDTLPGTILSINKKGILVHTENPYKALLFNDLEIFGLNKFLSKFYLNKLLEVGKEFKNAL